MMHHKKGFCSLICKKDEANAREQFASLYGIAPDLSFDIDDQELWLALTDDLKVVNSYTGKTSLIVIGDITQYMNERIDELVNNIENHGIAYVEDLTGSYTLLVIDQIGGHFHAITDYRSTHKVYCGRFGCSNALASHIDSFCLENLDVDPAGFAWFLSNVTIQTDRTIYRQLKILDRNSVYTFKVDRVDQRSLDPELDYEKYANTDEFDLSEELKLRLFRSVGDSISDKPSVMLPITGGWDSRAILSIMYHEYGYRNIHTFSYINGEVVEGSDAHCGQLVANHFSLSHQILQTSTRTLGHALIRNAELGQGMRDFVYEVDAWDKLDEIASGFTNPAIFIGDHLLGWYAKDLLDLDETFRFLAINRFSTLSNYAGLFGGETYSKLSDLIDNDIRSIREQIPLPLSQLTRIKEYLYLNNRFPRLLMPLGQYFAGQNYPVRRPLTNRHVARLVHELPEELQKGKVLFKRTMERLYPIEFSIPHASFGGFETDIYSLVVKNRMLVSKTIEATSGVAEEYLPTSACHELLRMITARSSSNILRKALRTVIPRQMRSNLREKLSGSEAVAIQPEKLLVKALVIRLFLSRRYNQVREIWGE